MSDWAWSHYADNAETVVLPEQRAIAVYANHKGTIVIRQEATGTTTKTA